MRALRIVFYSAAGLIGLFFDRWIGADYEMGLARLKAVAEATPPAN